MRFMRASVARRVHSLCTKESRETNAMSEKKEPQSYGGHDDWVTGRTEQTVNRQSDASYDGGGDDTSPPHQGGDTSPVQTREHAMPGGPPTDTAGKVSVEEGGAKRDGFFKSRDYGEKK